ncbi:MAG: hypothetical protein KDE27_09425 [Planctomycetes bacterium]|nr:hypothetical protein [Planctomycetota bacterium]
MKNKVFCIGTLKTGTTSIGRALAQLGYRHTSFNKDLLAEYKAGNTQRLLEFARDYEAFDDWPWAIADFYRDLDRAFPGSKFIYTDRALIPWAKSHYRYFYANPDWPHGDESTFDDQFPDTIMLRRNRKRRILEYFKDRPGDLLVIDVTAGEGWDKLCPFLGIEPLTVDFPHANKTADRG